MQPHGARRVRTIVSDVPDLRAVGSRLVHAGCALVLGQVTAWKLGPLLPRGYKPDSCSEIGPLFQLLALGVGCALVWYAAFDALRRARTADVGGVPAAIALSDPRSAPRRSPPRSR